MYDHHNPDARRQYRDKIVEAAELRKQLGQLARQSEQTGDLSAANKLFEEFSLRTKEVDALSNTLGPIGIFLAKHGVEVINEHTVSFVIPRGTSRVDILDEAQEFVPDHELIAPLSWELLLDDPAVTKSRSESKRVCIDGQVPGTEGLTREQQERFLAERPLGVPHCRDIVVAFALFM